MSQEFWVRDGDVVVGIVSQTDHGDWMYESHLTGRRIDLWPNFHVALDKLLEHVDFETKEDDNEEDDTYTDSVTQRLRFIDGPGADSRPGARSVLAS